MQNLKFYIMEKIETNRFTKGILDAIAYYFDGDKNCRMLRMSDEEYKQFQHDIEVAGDYIDDLKKNYL